MTVSSNEENMQEHVSIENLRIIYSSCFTCGVSWHEDHVTLDCKECGGYAMSRPCPACNGRCDSKWTRNLPASHENQKAAWDGTCSCSESSGSSASAPATVSSHQPSSCCFPAPSSQETRPFQRLHKSSKILSVS